MSTTPNSENQPPTTSAEIVLNGTSDVNQTVDYDVKEEDPVNDVTDEADSLTLDSLEEEEEVEHGGSISVHCFEKEEEEEEKKEKKDKEADFKTSGANPQNYTKNPENITDSKDLSGSVKPDYRGFFLQMQPVQSDFTLSSSKERRSDDAPEFSRKEAFLLSEATPPAATRPGEENPSYYTSDTKSVSGTASQASPVSQASPSSSDDSKESLRAGNGESGFGRKQGHEVLPAQTKESSSSVADHRSPPRSGEKLAEDTGGGGGSRIASRPQSLATAAHPATSSSSTSSSSSSSSTSQSSSRPSLKMLKRSSIPRRKPPAPPTTGIGDRDRSGSSRGATTATAITPAVQSPASHGKGTATTLTRTISTDKSRPHWDPHHQSAWPEASVLMTSTDVTKKKNPLSMSPSSAAAHPLSEKSPVSPPPSFPADLACTSPTTMSNLRSGLCTDNNSSRRKSPSTPTPTSSLEARKSPSTPTSSLEARKSPTTSVGSFEAASEQSPLPAHFQPEPEEEEEEEEGFSVRGLRKSPSTPSLMEPQRKSPCSPRSVESFPVTPGFGAGWDLAFGKWGKRRRSLCETMSVMSASGVCGPVGRDTVSSRLRIEKQHQDHHHHHHYHPLHHQRLCHLNHCHSLDDEMTTDTMGRGLGAGGYSSKTYLTPSQRKDMILRELKGQVCHLRRQLDERDRQLMEMRQTTHLHHQQTEAQLRQKLEETLGMAETAREEVRSLQESHEESLKTVALLQHQLADTKKEMATKLARAEEIFLEMYKKGRESAIFEREEELELQGKDTKGTQATEAELRHKLMRTQAELAKWQTIQRRDSYHATPRPATEAEMTLAFLKDSMFHFLTAGKTCSSDEHLRAVVRILEFSQEQKEKIAQAIVTKRNKAVM